MRYEGGNAINRDPDCLPNVKEQHDVCFSVRNKVEALVFDLWREREGTRSEAKGRGKSTSFDELFISVVPARLLGPASRQWVPFWKAREEDGTPRIEARYVSCQRFPGGDEQKEATKSESGI
jgi:hypothetical protein